MPLPADLDRLRWEGPMGRPAAPGIKEALAVLRHAVINSTDAAAVFDGLGRICEDIAAARQEAGARELAGKWYTAASMCADVRDLMQQKG